MEPGNLVLALADLSRTATGHFAVEDMLRSLCRAATETLDVDGAGVMVCSNGGPTRYVHASEGVTELERLQEVLQAGPCADALRSRSSLVVPDLEVDGAWPEYQRLGARLGVGSVVSVPLISRSRGWGSLDLYRRDPGPWAAESLQWAAALADLAVSYIVMAHDRDALRTAHAELAHQAMHDGLTGLPNRALLFDRLEHAIDASARSGAGVAVLFLDLDLFKAVNDCYGHTAADGVLVEVADRLRGAMRAGDTLARFGGDEFVLVCESLPHESAVELSRRVDALTRRLQAALRVPIRAGGEDVVVTASVGVAITTDATSGSELIADADTAMYSAKQAGRGRVSVRDHTMLDSRGYARKLERDLAKAEERGELRLHYQPILSSRTREVVAVESLLRWQPPGSGLLPAGAFIDVAVRSGVIAAIGRWVVEETCSQMAAWRQELGERAPATAYVNLSARELTDYSLSATVDGAMQRAGLVPGDLGLEIVEDYLADPEILTVLRGLQAAGHPLSVDDFGTGYSSLSRLVDLPIGVAKIDKALVSGLPDDARRGGLLESVLRMASALDFEVVAEGVETAAQDAYLTRSGCHLLQGYHVAQPAAGADLSAAWSS